MRSVAVVQSNYIPWKGYFDLIASADQFVLYDIVQFTKNDWRNRNLIKTASGPLWLTIPVAQSGRFGQVIEDVETVDDRWRIKHWRSLEQAYRRAPFFGRYRDRFEALYLSSTERRLAAINRSFIFSMADSLRITTPIASATDFELPDDRVDRLIEICRRFGASEYISGPAARAYLDEARFREAGLEIRYMDYAGYREYPQLYPPFEHKVSALDLLFNTGDDAREYLHARARGAADA